jgi:hypothetical protein
LPNQVPTGARLKRLRKFWSDKPEKEKGLLDMISCVGLKELRTIQKNGKKNTTVAIMRST